MRRVRNWSLVSCLCSFVAVSMFGCEEDDAEVAVTDSSSPAQAAEGGATPSRDGGVGGMDSGAAQPSGAKIRVTVADGELEGAVVGKTRQFLGIPYAKPPVGDLRWKLPQKADKWSGKRDATQYGKRCAQNASAVLMNAASADEDCLYLNVWAPEPAPKEPLPVMFWIHGGGNVNGSASEPVPYVNMGSFYSGQSLSEKGVIVVTINYRLGVFGFFAHPALANEQGANSGNQGLFDQAFALEWVKNNIAAFGGDPQKVTIFGESAGSQDVCLHVASPVSRPHFRAAISQSGGCTALNTTAQQGAAAAQTLASSLGCSDLACLRGKGVAELLTPPMAADGGAAPSFGPIVDGKFLPDQPRALFDRGEIAKVPYLLGSNSDEGTLFFTTPVNDPAQYPAILGRVFARPGESAADTAARVQPIAELYPVSAFPEGKPTPTTAAVARALGDGRLVCTTYDSAVRAAQAGSPVWMYNYSIPAAVGDLGATHGAELVYVFGTSTMFTPQSKAASERMQRYWTNFAKTGNPNGGSDPAWPAFSGAMPARLNLDLEATVVPDFRVKECEFWRTVYARSF